MSEETHPLVGKQLRSKWLIERVLGRGGMATVFAATHRNGMRGAIKLLHAGFADTPEVRARFVREGRAANKIEHPGVVKLLDDDVTEDGQLFLVMELLDGQSLRERWESAFRKLPLDEVVDIGIEVLDVLAAAHRAGIVHRDVKPDNIFLVGGSARAIKLLDFGIARMREGKTDATQDGSTLGTPAFMSPEQALAHWDDVDHRSDIFSLGATLWTLLTGRLVHPAKTVPELLIATATQQAPPITTWLPDLPRELARVIDRALLYDKSERWQSAADMRDALRAIRPRLGAGTELAARTVPLYATSAGTIVDAHSAPSHESAGGTIDLRARERPTSEAPIHVPTLVAPTVTDRPASHILGVEHGTKRSKGRGFAIAAGVGVPLFVLGGWALWRFTAAMPDSNPPTQPTGSSVAPEERASAVSLNDAACGQHGNACCATGDPCQSELDRCVKGSCRGSVSRLFGSFERACGVRADGRVLCWGNESLMGHHAASRDLSGPRELPGIHDPQALVFGKSAAFAIVERGLVGWGSNAHGLLGTSLPRNANLGPADATELHLGKVSDIAIGSLHEDVAACAIADGELRCWGRTAGIRDPKDSVKVSPINLAPMRRGGAPFPLPPARIGIGGSDFACSVLHDDLHAELACWGASQPWLVWNRKLADATLSSTLFVLSSAPDAFATGPSGACFASGSNLQCWGQAGSCAAKLDTVRQPPRFLKARVTDVAVALGHQCVILEGAGLHCWGPSHGAFGLASPPATCEPVPVAVPQQVLSTAIGNGFTCALSTTGAVYCYFEPQLHDEFGCESPEKAPGPCRISVPW